MDNTRIVHALIGTALYELCLSLYRGVNCVKQFRVFKKKSLIHFKCFHSHINWTMWADALISHTHTQIVRDFTFVSLSLSQSLFALFLLFFWLHFTYFGSFDFGDLVPGLQCHKLNWFKWPVHCYFRFMPCLAILLPSNCPFSVHVRVRVCQCVSRSRSGPLCSNKNIVKVLLIFPAPLCLRVPLWPHFNVIGYFFFVLVIQDNLRFNGPFPYDFKANEKRASLQPIAFE